MPYGKTMQVHLLILAGGAGTRLGGRSKADLPVGGRLLDGLLQGCAPAVSGYRVVVAPPEVAVSHTVIRVCEHPPLGGPLAGIGAGLEALGNRIGAGDSGAHLAAVVSVDSPGMVQLLSPLLDAVHAHPEADGAIGFGGAPAPFPQYLMGVYRVKALQQCLDRAAEMSPSGLHGQGVGKWLHHLNLIAVPCPAWVCRDIDTPEDLAWWQQAMGGPLADGKSTQEAE